MREQFKQEDNNFIDALKRINRLYLENRDIGVVHKELKKKALPQRANALLKNLFVVAHSENLTFTEELIGGMSLNNARKFLISEQKKKKERSMNEKKEDPFPSRIDVHRDSKSNSIYIKGDALKPIHKFLKHDLLASWNEHEKKWIIADPNLKKDPNEIYEKIVNKVLYNELRETKKEQYYQNPNEETLLVYGRASVLYTGVINVKYLEHQVDVLEEKQERGDRSVHRLYEALIATLKAYDELKEIGFLVEQKEEIKMKGELTSLPIARFPSREVKIVLAKNIEATKSELKNKLSTLSEEELSRTRA